jgi:hypothetical protein
MKKTKPYSTLSMKNKSSKNQRHIGKLVQRGFAIHQQLSLLNEEFKTIKDALKDPCRQETQGGHSLTVASLRFALVPILLGF